MHNTKLDSFKMPVSYRRRALGTRLQRKSIPRSRKWELFKERPTLIFTTSILQESKMAKLTIQSKLTRTSMTSSKTGR
jgi:hypothetical protein